MSPKTHEQLQEIREKSRERLLWAALELFAADGYHGTSISGIARKAGVAKGLVYNYFASKEELLEAVIDRGMQKLSEPLAELQTGNNPRSGLEHLATMIVASLRGERVFWQLFMSVLMQAGTSTSLREKLHATFRASTADFVARLEAMGVANAEMEAYKLSALFDGIAMHYLFVNDKFPMEEVLQLVVQSYPAAKARRSNKKTTKR